VPLACDRDAGTGGPTVCEAARAASDLLEPTQYYLPACARAQVTPDSPRRRKGGWPACPDPSQRGGPATLLRRVTFGLKTTTRDPPSRYWTWKYSWVSLPIRSRRTSDRPSPCSCASVGSPSHVPAAMMPFDEERRRIGVSERRCRAVSPRSSAGIIGRERRSHVDVATIRCWRWGWSAVGCRPCDIPGGPSQPGMILVVVAPGSRDDAGGALVMGTGGPGGAGQAGGRPAEDAREQARRLRAVPVGQVLGDLLLSMLTAAQVKLGRRDAPAADRRGRGGARAGSSPPAGRAHQADRTAAGTTCGWAR